MSELPADMLADQFIQILQQHSDNFDRIATITQQLLLQTEHLRQRDAELQEQIRDLRKRRWFR